MLRIFLFVLCYYAVACAGGILFASMGGLAWGTPEFQHYVMHVLDSSTGILMIIGVFWFFFL